jgi:uncharacterized membrane protein
VIPRPAFPRAVVLAVAIAAAVLVAFACIRIADWSYGADAGTFAQTILNAPSGMQNGFEGGSHFRYHFSPILALLYPLVALSHSLLALQTAQIALVLGAVFVFYALVLPHLGRRLATMLAILALLYPALPSLAFSEFHELAFAPLLVLAMLQAMDRRRWALYAVCCVLAACVREDVALTIAVFGMVALVAGLRAGDRARTIAGAWAILAPLVLLATYVFAILPRIGDWRPAHFYAYDRATATAASLTGRATYLLETFVPLALLPLLTRWIWLAVPGLAIVLLANSGLVWRMGMHYTALWLPWMLVATAAGVRYARDRWGERVATRWTALAMGLSALALLIANPMHLGHYLHPGYADLASARRALACVPLDASLATHDEWYAANAIDRPRATVGFFHHVEYYVFADDYPNDEFQTSILPGLRADARANFVQTCRFGKVGTYRRKGTSP